jgi:hypothetical protein
VEQQCNNRIRQLGWETVGSGLIENQSYAGNDRLQERIQSYAGSDELKESIQSKARIQERMKSKEYRKE